MTAKANEEDKLYAAVTPVTIVSVLKEKGITVSKDQIQGEPIKELGEHEITINLNHGLEARVALVINAE